MKKRMKRVIVLLMTAALMVSMLSVGALADGEDTNPEAEAAEVEEDAQEADEETAENSDTEEVISETSDEEETAAAAEEESDGTVLSTLGTDDTEEVDTEEVETEDTDSAPSYLIINADGKTITVTDDSTTTTEIQDAIDYIYALNTSSDSSAKTGWTITVSAGTYSRFVVPSGLDNLTIDGGSSGSVTITVFDGTTSSYVDDSTTDGSAGMFTSERQKCGILISDSANFTLENVTIEAENDYADYWACAMVCVGNGKTNGSASNGFTIENVVFDGNGETYGIFVENYTNKYTITGCEISDCTAGISHENTGGFYEEVTITNNAFTGCSFAFHGAYLGTGTASGGTATTGSLAGEFVFTGNTVAGTSSLRNKVVIQDSYDTNLTMFTISDNTLINAMIGLINIESGVDLEPGDLLEGNDFDENSYEVIAEYDYTNSKETGTIFVSSESSHGYWVLTNIVDGAGGEDLGESEGYNSNGTNAYVKSVIDAANASGSHTLTFNVDTEDLIRTFTWFKDAIYWVGSDEDEEEPSVTKSVDKSTVEAGDTVTFTLNVSAPEYLGIYGTTSNYNSIIRYPECVDYSVTVHDVMNSVFTMNNDLTVTVNGMAIDSSYYTVLYSVNLSDGCAFEIEIDLAGLLDAGVLVADDSGAYPDVVITYTATVAEGTAAGSYDNTTWVTYETDGISDTSTVTVTVEEPAAGTSTTTTTTGTTQSVSATATGDPGVLLWMTLLGAAAVCILIGRKKMVR